MAASDWFMYKFPPDVKDIWMGDRQIPLKWYININKAMIVGGLIADDIIKFGDCYIKADQRLELFITDAHNLGLKVPD